MPPLPGEVILCTLFTDVHYYFSHPAARPPHHRFDKRSYLYLYHDALNRRGRLEVANYAGTPDQDAFMGYLDSSSIEYSYKHPTLFTITADARGNPASPSHPQQADLSQWHLPASDPQNQGKYMYKIHTLDLYLWTAEDASLLVDSFKRVVAESQLRLLDIPPQLLEHRDSVSPVVQQLERAAISEPYNPVGTNIPVAQEKIPNHMNSNLPPQNSLSVSNAQVQTSGQQPGYAAIAAYNPAAPAAPEPVAHREKTPPPPDAESGTGLSAAERHETVSQFAGPPQQQSFGPQTGQPYFTGPPSAVGGMAPPVQPQLHRAGNPSLGGPTPPQQQSPYQPTFAPPPTLDPNAHLHAQQVQPGLTRAATFGGYPAYASQQPGFGAPPGTIPPSLAYQQAHASPIPAGQPPAYQQQQYAYGSHETANINHSIHQMVYIPEQGKNAGVPATAGPGQASATGWIEKQINKPNKVERQFDKKVKQGEALSKSSKFESRINKFLKKLDEGV